MQIEKGIIEVKNISTVRKLNFTKSAETNFYIRVKECSDLKVEQCIKCFSTLLTRKVKILIKTSNLGPDTEPDARCTDLITNHNNLEVLSFTVSKGSCTYEDGEFKWNIGALSPKETCFALITLKTKWLCSYKSMAVVCGENHDPCLLNNIDFEIISPFGKLIHSFIKAAYTQLEKQEELNTG